MRYRKSEREDCRAVYGLICELEECEFDYGRFEEIYGGQLDCERFFCLVCEMDGAVVAALNMRFEDQLHHACRVAEILEFLVLPEYRSRGIGKEMFALAMRIAQEHGCGEIELTSGRQRASAHRFYGREGMVNSHVKFTKKL